VTDRLGAGKRNASTGNDDGRFEPPSELNSIEQFSMHVYDTNLKMMPCITPNKKKDQDCQFIIATVNARISSAAQQLMRRHEDSGI
jgi:hypothetical protein